MLYFPMLVVELLGMTQYPKYVFKVPKSLHSLYCGQVELYLTVSVAYCRIGVELHPHV